MDGSTSKLTATQLAEMITSMFPDKTIALVGVMGAGKSTIGRQLAPLIGRKFVDSDIEIENAARLSVTEIFEKLGEAEFRRGEQAVIKRLLDGPPIVLGTGGGAFIAEDTRQALREKAVTLWLDADFETLWGRVSRRNTRPLLNQPNARQILADLIQKREPFYAQADIVVKSKDISLELAVNEVLHALAKFIKLET